MDRDPLAEIAKLLTKLLEHIDGSIPQKEQEALLRQMEMASSKVNNKALLKKLGDFIQKFELYFHSPQDQKIKEDIKKMAIHLKQEMELL